MCRDPRTAHGVCLLRASRNPTAVTPLIAAGGPKTEAVLFTVLVQLMVIILAARLFAALARRVKQPGVVGEIAAGLVLGPSCFGYFFPDLSLRLFDPAVSDIFGVLGQLGLVLMMFVVGLEFDTSHLRVHGRAAAGVSLTGIALPFALGAGLAHLVYPYLEPNHAGQPVPELGFLLFMGVAMAITAIPVLGRIMIELGIIRTRIGALTISAAAVDDASGWILLATIASIVRAEFQFWHTVAMIAETLGFFLAMVVVVRPPLKRFLRSAIERGQGDLGPSSLSVVYAAVFLSALATNLIGIFAIFGAFMLGTVLSDEPQLREIMGRHLRNFLTVIFLPIFFTYTGLRTDVGTLHTAWHWLAFLAVLACAVGGKLGGCGLAAWLGGQSPREAFCIGAMMNTRGLMELVVINLGRDLGVVPDSVFCMLVFMALATTVMTTPLLLWAMKGTELEPHVARSGFLSGSAGRDENGRPHESPGSHLMEDRR